MKSLLQVVNNACVNVEGETINSINKGLLVFVAVEKNDSYNSIEKMAKKIANLRIFHDSDGKSNLSITDTKGEILLISQFTLSANTNKGLRPSFDNSAPPKLANDMYLSLKAQIELQGITTKIGLFGAYMQVSLINDGPATYWLSV